MEADFSPCWNITQGHVVQVKVALEVFFENGFIALCNGHTGMGISASFPTALEDIAKFVMNPFSNSKNNLRLLIYHYY